MQAQTSRYHGVRQNKRTKKWEAYIRVLAKHVHLGCHDCEIAAAQVGSRSASALTWGCFIVHARLPWLPKRVDVQVGTCSACAL